MLLGCWWWVTVLASPPANVSQPAVAYWAVPLAVAFSLDGMVDRRFPRSPRDSWGWRWVNGWGGAGGLFTAIGLWTWGSWEDHAQWAEDGLAMMAAGVSGMVVTGTLKVGFGRLRPDAWPPGAADPDHWFVGGDSFPSGHATLAFALSTAWAERRPRPRWQRVTAYLLATATALARVRYRRHWLSDVVAGAAVGQGVGRWAAQRGESSWRPTVHGLSWRHTW